MKFSKKALGRGALGSYFLGCFKKKNHQSKFSIPLKNSRFPNFWKKKFKIFNSFEKFKFSKFKKKIFIKFLFRNRKLWSSSTFSSDATSSQLSTLSIHRNMEYVPNWGHSPSMPNSFQWITLLLIENVYFASTSVKAHTHRYE